MNLFWRPGKPDHATMVDSLQAIFNRIVVPRFLALPRFSCLSITPFPDYGPVIASVLSYPLRPGNQTEDRGLLQTV